MTEDIRAADSVKRWFASAGHDAAPAQTQEHYLHVLVQFSAHAGKPPDDLVAFCFLRKRGTGERFVSVKRRVTMNEWIAAFVAEQGWRGKDAVANANIVRGFLIHNGVLIQGKVWTGS
ncbi:hypothetical protein [Pseudonocardia asaccharolytica]|uniref:Integrase SAM-like N-terminal domain-containing protein n=1 Tax=Pseudonocardia asaccharolytica DSM 44247 = NBRC 16224 TaxID=1123024 RepID=A0A511CZY8_9PSEU|nr:hypothetical protein [Pseudonocardia asaccharolytica]GEL18111.1 hypothetical protein PA7_19480 [Pseudonocardia asaccharolytica DSM 44247 = NBRC 16224]